MQRQLALLTRHFHVTALGHVAPGIDEVEFVGVSARHWSAARKLLVAGLLKVGLYEYAYWSSQSVTDAARALRGRAFDLIVANDILALPLALRVKGAGKVLFDAHEYAPREFEENWRWRFFLQRFNEYLCRRYMPMADVRTTVSEGIAREYEKVTGTPVIVISNAAPYYDLQPRVVAPDERIRLVHHGAAIASRSLDLMIDMMNHVDKRFSLDLLLVPADLRYLRRLQKLAARQSQVRILPPVPMRKLPQTLNTYDVGVYLLKPNSFNNEHALPNKFFEFIQGRLAIAIGPSPEMARLVHQYDCGIVADDFAPQSLARELNELTHERIARHKMNAHRAATDLCYENASRVLLKTIDEVLGNR